MSSHEQEVENPKEKSQDSQTRLQTERYQPAPVMTTVIISLALIHLFISYTGIEEIALARFALIPEFVFVGEWWRLFTALLLHANWVHLFNNAFGFWMFGDRLKTEAVLGVKGTIAVLLLTGAIGNLLSCFFLPEHSLSIGASGATYGMLGAYFGVMSYWKRLVDKAEVSLQKHRRVAALSGDLPPEEADQVLTQPDVSSTEAKLGSSNPKDLRTAIILLVVFIAIHYQEGHLNLWAHLGGLLSGVGLGWLLAKRQMRLNSFY